MLSNIIDHLLQRDSKIPETYARLLKNEYRNVPAGYVEQFVRENNRLPNHKELVDAI